MRIKKILVSQPKPTTEKSPYFDLAEEFGLKLEFKSFIKGGGCLRQKNFGRNGSIFLTIPGIVFTSRTAIDHFFRICNELRVAVPDTMKYFCISEAVAFYLAEVYRISEEKDFLWGQESRGYDESFVEAQDRALFGSGLRRA